MSIKIVVGSICIITMYLLLNYNKKSKKNLKIESYFINIIQKPKRIYNCFLQPRQLYEYKYIGSIKELKKILNKHNIIFLISAVDYIYLCTKDSIDFEIRISKFNDNYLIQFIPIAGNPTELINLITI